MQIIVTENYERSCEIAARMIADVIREKPDARLGLATGGTAEAVYANLIKEYREGRLDFSKVSTINLDEYIGLPPEHPQSYRYFMDYHLFNHVNIDKQNTYVVSGMGDIEQNVADFRRKVQEEPADIQLLGIGANGHIAFNEPGSVFMEKAHVVELTESTVKANSRFFDSIDEVPRKAITMGIREIMSAKSLVLVATGKEKAQAVRGLIMGDVIDSRNPSTVIKLHHNATVIIDNALYELVASLKD